MYAGFMDLEKAYDRVNREALQQVLRIYIYAYACVYLFTCISMRVRIYARVYLFTCISMRVCIARVYLCTYVSIYAYIYACVHLCTQ